MEQVLETSNPTSVSEKSDFRDAVFYPESHEDDMGESSIHYKLISYLFSAIRTFPGANQEDIFIAANMNLYYEKGNPQKYYTPDVMIAFGVPNHDRKVYKLWEERQFPQVIFEVASDRTWKKDISDKVEIYEKFGADEYYLLDPENAYLPLPLMAYRRDESGRLRLLFTENNRVPSPLLNLEIVWKEGRFRLFDPGKQEFLLTTEEMKAELDRLKAELDKRS